MDKVELIKCGGGSVIDAAREQWNDGSNTLAVAPGVVVVYGRNHVTNEILRESGIETLGYPQLRIIPRPRRSALHEYAACQRKNLND